MDKRINSRLYTVFELVNEKRLEIYVGAARAPLVQAAGALHPRSESIKDWDLDDAGAVRGIEGDMSEQDARAFIKNYVQTALPEGWRFLT